MSKKQFLLLVLSIFLYESLVSQKTEYNDGPYIDVIKDSIRIRWIEEGLPHDSAIHKSNTFIFDRPSLPKVDLSKINYYEESEYAFPNVEKYIVLGDPHGQYAKVFELLKVNKVIDSLNNWSFGDGHLVVMGDYFGRGDQVMEILWLFFNLEQQAALVNGHVHILIGNHDIMTMDKDLRYLNVKYLYTSGALRSNYSELFSNTSVLGNWLRSKNIAITLNDHLLVHAGLSTDMVRAELDIEHLNNAYRKSITKKLGKDVKYDKTENLILGDSGPFWYRGYSDSTYINDIIIDSVLSYYNVSHIIVGHTITNKLKTVLDGKVIFVDCGLFAGNNGQLLKYSKDEFSKLDHTGDKAKLFKNKKTEKVTIFDYLYSQNGEVSLTIKTNLKELIKNKLKETYQPANITFKSSGNEITLNGKIRARGNIRKHVCYLPPVKFNFNKSELSKNNFKSSDKLKLVLTCRNNDTNNEKLLQEYFLYTLYQVIDSNGIRAKVVNLTVLNDNNKIDQNLKALCIEDEDAFAIRMNAQLLPEKGVINSKVLDRTTFVRMYFFQYMIGNTDWSIANRHNVLMSRLGEENKLIIMPYDFDYSGFVNQSYAVPHESLPIKSVTERHFMSYPITEREFEDVVAYYLSKKEEILSHCSAPSYLQPKTIKENIRFISQFFDLLDKGKNLKKELRIEN